MRKHTNQFNNCSKYAEVLSRAATNMIESAPAEEMLEGAKIVTAAISDAGIILRLDNGVKFTYTCLSGRYKIDA